MQWCTIFAILKTCWDSDGMCAWGLAHIGSCSRIPVFITSTGLSCCVIAWFGAAQLTASCWRNRATPRTTKKRQTQQKKNVPTLMVLYSEDPHLALVVLYIEDPLQRLDILLVSMVSHLSTGCLESALLLFLREATEVQHTVSVHTGEAIRIRGTK